MFAKIAQKRREAFDDLNTNLARVGNIVRGIDPKSRIFLFGSVAKGKWNLGSDIDVLIVTDSMKWEIAKILEKSGFGVPYEFHIRSSLEAEAYHKPSGKAHSIYGWDESEAIFSRINTLK